MKHLIKSVILQTTIIYLKNEQILVTFLGYHEQINMLCFYMDGTCEVYNSTYNLDRQYPKKFKKNFEYKLNISPLAIIHSNFYIGNTMCSIDVTLINERHYSYTQNTDGQKPICYYSCDKNNSLPTTDKTTETNNRNNFRNVFTLKNRFD